MPNPDCLGDATIEEVTSEQATTAATSIPPDEGAGDGEVTDTGDVDVAGEREADADAVECHQNE